MNFLGALLLANIHTGGEDVMVTCGDCHRRGPKLVIPSPYISPFCLHKPRLCLDCVQRNIESTIDQGLIKFISCPECGAQLDDDDIYRLTTSELYERLGRNDRSP